MIHLFGRTTDIVNSQRTVLLHDSQELDDDL